jgi:uncharacterized membrane protein (DUF4010 family)
VIGIERGWTMREEAEGERTVGLRTFALSGLLGGVVATLSTQLPGGAIILALAFPAYAAMIGFFRYREMERDKIYGATTVVAACLAFALGGLAGVGEMGAAAAAGVAVAALLALKAVLHAWLERLTWAELRAGLLLLAMTLILLPILPNQGFGPFEALNPYELWLMTILIAVLSSAGYVALKWLGGTPGVALAGAAGGLVSSMATTLSFSRLARENKGREGPLMAGALLASATMMVRIAVIAGSVNAALLRWLLLPLLFAALAYGGLAALYLKARGGRSLAEPLALKSPFELSTVLKFGAFLALVMVAAKGFTIWAGDRGAYTLAAVSGIADVDAITLSLSRLGGKALELETAAAAILVAAAVNSLAKAALAGFAGGRGPALRLALGAGLALAAGLCGYALGALWNPLTALGAAELPA